jgi:hypothetical protein
MSVESLLLVVRMAFVVVGISSGAMFLEILFALLGEPYDNLENGFEFLLISCGAMFVDFRFAELGRSYDGLEKGEEEGMSCKLAFADLLSAGVYALCTGLGLTISSVGEGASSDPGDVD